jgi:hypothetical protein
LAATRLNYRNNWTEGVKNYVPRSFVESIREVNEAQQRREAEKQRINDEARRRYTAARSS